MIIEYNPLFNKQFNQVWNYIAQDSVKKANSFKKQIKKEIENIVNFPYKFRKSFYFDDENIRDFVYKGYTIPYLVDIENEKIIILDIFKWQDR